MKNKFLFFFVPYRLILFVLLFIVALILAFPINSFSYSLFAHEAIIDMAWDKSIKPLLKLKFHSVTDSELVVAESYSYGGAIIPDIGYYPMGSAFFTNLVHYVKTGDFVNALIDEAKDLNEYAFALGVLCHYYSDKYGHTLCTNKAVPLLFPELKEKYGDIVNYEQGETPHTRVEFGFDVVQMAMGKYLPTSYHDFIGFQVSQSVLERAFLKVYKLELKDIFTNLPLAISVFRFTVKTIIPELTKDAWRIRKSFITQLNPFEEKDTFEYKIDKDAYEKEFGKIPVFSIILSFIIGIIPKIGPLEVYKFKEPSPEVEFLYNHANHIILIKYIAQLKKLHYSRPKLENINFDTGNNTIKGEYKLADETLEDLIEIQRKK